MGRLPEIRKKSEDLLFTNINLAAFGNKSHGCDRIANKLPYGLFNLIVTLTTC
jgi:hypothetical protein